MIEPNVGDYVVSSEEMYEIIHKGLLGEVYLYTVRLIDNPADVLNFEATCADIKNTMSLPNLQKLGNIIKKEEASKAIEILFKK